MAISSEGCHGVPIVIVVVYGEALKPFMVSKSLTFVQANIYIYIVWSFKKKNYFLSYNFYFLMRHDKEVLKI